MPEVKRRIKIGQVGFQSFVRNSVYRGRGLRSEDYITVGAILAETKEWRFNKHRRLCDRDFNEVLQ